MKGFRTLFVAFMVAISPGALSYFADFDWPGFLASLGVPHQWQVPLAGLLSGAVMFAFRLFTNTPVGKSE